MVFSRSRKQVGKRKMRLQKGRTGTEQGRREEVGLDKSEVV